MTAALKRLNIYHFRHELAQPIATVMGPMTHRPALLVRIEDDEGAAGWGEIWCNFPPDGDLHRARLAARVAAIALNGMTADTDHPFRQIIARLHRLAIQSGEPGPVAQVACGFDIALNDLAARRAGVPLAVHLGGKVRGLPAYASGISPDKAPAQVERMRALGFTRFKQRIGFGPDDGLPAAEATAAALHPGDRLMLDANQSWDIDRALTQCARLAPLGIDWMEEPLPVDASAADWARLAKAAEMPLAGGENVTGDSAFAEVIARGALHVIQPDICKWGGLSTTRDIARNALASGRRYCPHFLGGGVGLVASAHLLAAVGGDGLLEVDSSENPLLDHFSGQGGGLTLEQGLFPLADAPGLGFTPDVGGMGGLLHDHTEVQL